MVRLLLMAALWLLPFWVQAAAIVAQLDHNPVALGDPVILTFSTNGMVSDEPDFSPLKQDFEIRQNAQSNSFSMINGVSTVSTAWKLTLYPRKTGTVTIPAIQFGSDTSQALDLQVLDQPQPAAGGAPDIFIELSAEPQQPFVQQQVLITQRIFYITPWENGSANIASPEVEKGKGDIQRIGREVHSTKAIKGRNYNVTEVRYALIPQQSGTLTLGRTTFEGVLAEPGASTFDPFGLSGKRIKRFSEPLTLQIQEQPARYTGKQWLPANSITLNAHWETPPDKLKAGEPVTLTLAIVADGLTAEQLPKLDIPVPAGIKAYTDQPELRNDAGNNGVVGVRQEKWVVVAPYNGEYTFPGISVDWWNTSTGKQETAKVEPAKMVVTGGAAAPASPSTSQPLAAASVPEQPPAAASVPEQPPAAASVPEQPPAASVAPATGESWFSWGWFAVGLLLIWAMVSLAWLAWLWWRAYRSPRHQTARTAVAPLRKPVDPKTAWRQLEQACQQNKPQASHDALVQWVGVGLNIHPALLASLREQAPPRLQVEIDALNAVLYGRSSGGWQGAALLKALQGFKPSSPAHSNDSGLSTLYPD